MAPRDTGLPQTDAQFDFGRARRKRALSQIAARLRREGDLSAILPFEEVVRALGQRGEKSLGLQTIELDSIVGTVDRGREFDRSFRPTSGRVRPRWERINTAQRKGQEMPPIDVYRIGELHFVKDGHHRVSVARALGFRRDRRLRDGDRHRARRGPRDPDDRPCAQEPPAPVLREGAATGRRPSRDQALR